MVKRSIRKDINNKINYILYLIEGINMNDGMPLIGFDNTIPNKYKIYKGLDDEGYVFTTYNDVINALELIRYLQG